MANIYENNHSYYEREINKRTNKKSNRINLLKGDIETLDKALEQEQGLNNNVSKIKFIENKVYDKEEIKNIYENDENYLNYDIKTKQLFSTISPQVIEVEKKHIIRRELEVNLENKIEN